eukprot:1161504-Pelagomonas_calceolata.AAC.2
MPFTSIAQHDSCTLSLHYFLLLAKIIPSPRARGAVPAPAFLPGILRGGCVFRRLQLHRPASSHSCEIASPSAPLQGAHTPNSLRTY